MKTIATLAVALACVAGSSSLAKDTPEQNPVLASLSEAPAADLPMLAARLVKNARFRDREATTINVVKAAVIVNPGAVPVVVAAMARAVPEMAAVAAGTAAGLQPRQAANIAKAAAAAAPGRAGKIVAAICLAVPADYREIALAAAEGAPTSGKDILRSVGLAVPGLKPYIDQELAGYGLSAPPVAAMLDEAAAQQGRGLSLAVSTAPSAPSDSPLASPVALGAAPTADARGPLLGTGASLKATSSQGASAGGPPFVPFPQGHPNIQPPTNAPAPPGGRNYARP